jgi:dTDP-4-amino-4,6-dideoxygalactose transaminase
MNYPLTSSNWSEQENRIIYKIVKSKNLTMGNSVKIFEEDTSRYYEGEMQDGMKEGYGT